MIRKLSILVSVVGVIYAVFFVVAMDIEAQTTSYPGFFMETNKGLYNINDATKNIVELTLRRADGNTSDLYPVDLFAIPPDKHQSDKVLLVKNMMAGYNTVHRIDLTQHPVFLQDAGIYLLLVCHVDGCNLNGGTRSNSTFFWVFVANAPVITAIEPTQGYQGTVSGVMTISGRNFTGAGTQSGCDLSYRFAGGGFQIVSCQEVSDTQINAPFTILHTAEPGARPIGLSTPRGGLSNTVNFTVLAGPSPLPSIAVTSPNGGEEWVGGGIKNISWSGGWSARDVSIQLIDPDIPISQTTNYNYYALKTTSDSFTAENSFMWTVGKTSPCPNCALQGLTVYPGKYKIRLVGPGGNQVDSAVFSVVPGVPPPITVVSPNGGEIFKVGEDILVQWRYNDPSQYANRTIRVELYKGDQYIETWFTTGSQTSYRLQTSLVDARLSTGNYKILVSDSEDIVFADRSDSDFAVTPKSSSDISKPPAVAWSTYKDPEGRFQMDFPANWEMYDDSTDLIWISPRETVSGDIISVGLGIETNSEYKNVSLQEALSDVFSEPIRCEYLVAKTGLKFCKFVRQSETEASTYYAILEGDTLYAPLLEVRGEFAYDKYELDVLDRMVNSFVFTAQKLSKEIQKPAEEKPRTAISLSSPNGKERWSVGNRYEISWTSSANTFERVTVSLYKDNKFVRNLVWGLTNTGSVFWTPDIDLVPADNYKIRVIHPDIGVEDESDTFFSILKSESIQCLQDGTLIKSPDDPKVYVIRGCKKEWVRTQEEFQAKGYQWEEVQVSADSVVDAYADYLIAQANLLRAIDQDKVYRIISGKKLWIPTETVFNTQKLDWHNVAEVEARDVAAYPRAKLIRAKNDLKVYYITESGLKKWIQNEEIFSSYSNKWEDVIEVDPDIISSLDDMSLVRVSGQSKVYKLENGKKRWIKTVEAFVRYNFDWSLIAPINQIEFNFYAEGKVIE
jgi:hypothetical protein